MLRDKAVIGYIGLPEREIAVIQCIFSLTETLNNTFQLPQENERRSADVIFVNADTAECVADCERFMNQKPGVIPIYVSTDGHGYDTTFSLKRPILLKRVIDVLENVRTHYTESSLIPPTDTSTAGYFNILVVDDSLPMRTHMQHKLLALSPIDTNVEFAESGDDAISKLKSGRHFDLIFMDVMMPGTDGYKTCKWIKSNSPTFVVMLTSRGSSFDKIRGAMSGCDTYLVKPPEDGELQNILKEQVENFINARADNNEEYAVRYKS